jgi:cytochrome P450
MGVEYNFFDPAVVDHDTDILRTLRQTCPVSEVLPGVYYVARHDDIVAVSRDTAHFPQAPFSPLADDARTPDQLQLGESNPPIHAKMRKLIGSVLTPPRMRAMEPLVEQTCRELVDRFVDAGSADIIRDLARPLPEIVVGHLTGVPAEDRHLLHDYSDLVVATVQHHDPEVQQAAQRKVAEFDAHLLDVIRERRSATDRPDDAMTALVDYRDEDGRPLSDEKILLHLSKDLITGGIDTTTHMVGNLFFDLLSTPGAYERVRADRSLVPQAVEESLRRRPVVNVLFRKPPADVEIAGVTVPGGTIVALGYAAANHDESLFPEPERFDLDRGDEVRRHLGFGWGPHLCVGAPLARLEGAHALGAVLDRIATMRLKPGAQYQRVETFMMRGPVRVDVEFEAA